MRWPVWLILAGSIGVHLPRITSPLLDYHAHRQTQTASMSRNFAREGMSFLSPVIDFEGPPQRAGTEFPIYSYLIALLYRLFGIHEILGRIVSVLFTAWGSIFLFQLVERRLGTATGAAAALVMNAIPIHLYFSRTFMPEPMALWGLIGFANSVDRWIHRRQPRDLAASIALGATASLLKLPYLYVVGGLWALLWLAHREMRRSVVSWSIPAWILGLTAAWYAWSNSAPVQVVPTGLEYHLDNLKPLLTLRLWRAQWVSRFPELATTYTGLLLGVIGAYVLLLDAASRIFFGGWWAATFVYTALTGEYGLIHRYTLLPWAPVNAVFIAAGIIHLWQRAQARRLPQALVIVLVAAVPVHSVLRVKHWYRTERLFVFEAKKTIDALGRPDDLVLTVTKELPVYLYYLDRRGWAAHLPEHSTASMDALIAKGARWALIPIEDAWRNHSQWSHYFTRRGRLTRAETDFLLYEFR